ncbi:hypothetical protein I8H83_03085 [Candidatus Saccharibacteria bacterium]|nr:hypothetical protein [Candidatus Saccharibacteria bacterium]MBH2007560.1 hypothetical protein [Candidatus Saccharibacteria bacterium]
MQTSEPEPVLVKKLHSKKPFVALITGAVLVSLILVLMSMYLYNMSGAAQLDLSLPGLQEERIRAQQAKRYDGFNAAGKLDQKAFDQFDELYKKQQADIQKDINGFDSTPLEDGRLGIKVE